MKRTASQEGKAVDVAEMYFSGEEEEEAEQKEEQYRTGEIRVVHEVLIDVAEGVQDGEGLDTRQILVSRFVISVGERDRKGQGTFAWM